MIFLSFNDRDKDIETPIEVDYDGILDFNGPFVKPDGSSTDICIGCRPGKIPVSIQDSFTCILNNKPLS